MCFASKLCRRLGNGGLDTTSGCETLDIAWAARRAEKRLGKGLLTGSEELRVSLGELSGAATGRRAASDPGRVAGASGDIVVVVAMVLREEEGETLTEAGEIDTDTTSESVSDSSEEEVSSVRSTVSTNTAVDLHSGPPLPGSRLRITCVMLIPC